MNNEIDLLDELEREERDERLAAGGGGIGAALGTLLVFVIGCGLVFSAYKLGQRKTVDEPPRIAANDAPIKVAPVDAGGSEIANLDNAANAMIDGSRPAASEYILRDGIVVEANLPEREVDQIVSTAQTREIRREVQQLTDLPRKTGLEGEPSLGLDAVPDRTAEQMMVAGAEVAPSGQPSLDDLVAAARAEEAAEIAEIEPDGATASDPDAAGETELAASTDAAPDPVAALGITMPMPVAKPNLGPSADRAPREVAEAPATPALAPETRPEPPQVRQRLQPAIARVSPPIAPPTNGLTAPTPNLQQDNGIRRVRIPPQPLGDAQVQLGAYPSPNETRSRWAAIKARNPDLLGQLGLQVLPVETGDGRQLFRMRVGPLRDTVRAAQLCQALAGRGVDCFVPQRR